MNMDERKAYLAELLSKVSQAEILSLAVFSLLIGGSLAACQTAGIQPTSSSPSGQTSSELASTAGLIQLQNPLDEPEFYCVDVPGAGLSLNLQSALQAHTCKLTAAEDETFTFNYPSVGQIYMEAFQLCVEADRVAAGTELRLQECADQPRQRFEYRDGLIRLHDAGAGTLCLAIAPGAGTPTGGPSHLRRDLALQPCGEVEAALSEWQIP
jgi:hypothetical protein